MQEQMTGHERQAYELGADHARDAAAWVIDGNTKREFIPAVLELFENGDPALENYLPREPNLSGEYADEPTPAWLFEQVTGEDVNDVLASADPSVIHALCDAYEVGVLDTFIPECERILRDALED